MQKFIYLHHLVISYIPGKGTIMKLQTVTLTFSVTSEETRDVTMSKIK